LRPVAPGAGSALGRIPWTFLIVAAAAAAIQTEGASHAGLRDQLIYDRGAIAAGAWWRVWTGHLVHFGWSHFLADTGLFVILGCLIERQHPWLSRFALAAMPAVISGGIFFFEPAMTRYGGLSAVNLGLLVFLACKGWQKNWFDWFWPAVLAIYVAEVVFESVRSNGRGGGMIEFDDPSVRVATGAHVWGAAFGLALWAVWSAARRPSGIRAGGAGR